MKRDRTKRVSASDSLFSVSEMSNGFSSRGGSFMSLLLSKVTMRSAGETAQKKSGGYNVAWLVMVQAIVWNILFPVYLMTNGYVLLVLVTLYLLAMKKVADRDTSPRFVSLEQYQKVSADTKSRAVELLRSGRRQMVVGRLSKEAPTNLKSNPLQT